MCQHDLHHAALKRRSTPPTLPVCRLFSCVSRHSSSRTYAKGLEQLVLVGGRDAPAKGTHSEAIRAI